MSNGTYAKKKEKVEFVKQMIEDAIFSVENNGFKVKFNNWGVHWSEKNKEWVKDGKKSCCPMGAVLLYYQPGQVTSFSHHDEECEAAAKALGIRANSVNDFIEQFDNPNNPYTNSSLYARLGRELNKKYVK